MAIAVIKTGGKQYKVEENDTIKVEKLPEGKIEFTDLLAGKKVAATVAGGGRHDKVSVFKFHAKKHYKRNVGHAQAYSLLKIDSIR